MLNGNRKEGGLRRVVVTGAGLVSPVGNDVESCWASMLAGRSGGGPVTLFDATDDFASRIACEVKGFDPLESVSYTHLRAHET